MYEISSTIEGQHHNLYKLEQLLKPQGYSIGGNWDYDHGYFDYKIDDELGYHFLRVPFSVVDGQLDSPGVTVRLERPFLLSHKYQQGVDDFAGTGTFSGSFNQFSEPVDPDATIPKKYISYGKDLVKDLEEMLQD
ncbi:hypothetical protein J2S13_002950 [Oikeobacillus pervagus]|uniref:YugN-like family protein n=1 Tax=Oikeobacillus pervagus TaxID=1325931 RepID=A0AAJ1T0P0_9BACI|nr:YugN-like family protein [Oikeobacillus pervagus]MDQ0216490.1 hypothetical protein [Oikeobacillus pervagus]